MSQLFVNPFTRRGKRRCPKRYMLALEYLLYPGKKPHGMQKVLAHANGLTPSALNSTVNTIVRGAKARARSK